MSVSSKDLYLQPNLCNFPELSFISSSASTNLHILYSARQLLILIPFTYIIDELLLINIHILKRLLSYLPVGISVMRVNTPQLIHQILCVDIMSRAYISSLSLSILISQKQCFCYIPYVYHHPLSVFYTLTSS